MGLDKAAGRELLVSRGNKAAISFNSVRTLDFFVVDIFHINIIYTGVCFINVIYFKLLS